MLNLVRMFKMRLYAFTFLRHLRWLPLSRLRTHGNGRQIGRPIVRYYWADFLDRHRADILGRALEIGTTDSLREYGRGAVTEFNAIDIQKHSPDVTVVTDLSRADSVPAAEYDCFINQFTMHLIYDVEAALYHSIRLLTPGGVLLVNFPCVDYYFPTGLDMGTGVNLYAHHWFTPIQVENFLRRFDLTPADYSIRVYGNLLTRVAYQLNLPAEACTKDELNHEDPGHPLLICARVVKPGGWQPEPPSYRDPWLPADEAARWNAISGHYAEAASN